jgi:hypothetical protein
VLNVNSGGFLWFRGFSLYSPEIPGQTDEPWFFRGDSIQFSKFDFENFCFVGGVSSLRLVFIISWVIWELPYVFSV